jgi:cyclic patellamide precursor peptide PatG
MEQNQNEVQEQTANPSAVRDEKPATVPPFVEPAAQTISPQACATCGTAPAASPGAAPSPSYVYAIGNLEARFPTIATEKEFMQIAAQMDSKGMTQQQLLSTVVAKAENRYLLRKLCFVMKIRGLETYIVVPRDPSDYSLLAESIRPNPSPTDLDVVIGMKLSIAPPTMCNGLMVPIVAFDQTYHFPREMLLKAALPPDKKKGESAAVAEELFDRILQMTDNTGNTEHDRALNYLAVRYQAIYAKTAEYLAQDYALSAIDVRPSPLSGTRNVLDVIFCYTNRNTAVVEKSAVRVDVTEEFPFLVTPLSPYYDR